MKLTVLAGCAALGVALAAPAQNVVITNARIIDGTGKVIERGSVVARDGRIVSVTSGGPNGRAAAPPSPQPPPARPHSAEQRIDAHGMTVLAGFIDAHRHIIRGETTAWLKDHAAENLKSFVTAGFTTVFSMGDDPHGILELRRRLAAGEIAGPTLYAARIIPLAAPMPAPTGAPPRGPYTDLARTDPARPPNRPTSAPPAIPDEQSRAAVRSAKAEGFDAIKTFMLVIPGGPESHTLAVIADEAHKQGLRVFTHATAVPDALAAINAHVDVLAHTPHIGHLEDDEAARQTILDSHIPMVSTLAVFIPHFDADNKPLFRDGGPFPMPRPLASGGQGPVNARISGTADLPTRMVQTRSGIHGRASPTS